MCDGRMMVGRKMPTSSGDAADSVWESAGTRRSRNVQANRRSLSWYTGSVRDKELRRNARAERQCRAIRVMPNNTPIIHRTSNHTRQPITARGSGIGPMSPKAGEPTPDELRPMSYRTEPVDAIVTRFAGSRASEIGVIQTSAINSFKNASRQSQDL